MKKPETHIYFETKAQLALVRRAAKAQDKSLTRFCLRAIVAAAESVAQGPQTPQNAAGRDGGAL